MYNDNETPTEERKDARKMDSRMKVKEMDGEDINKGAYNTAEGINGGAGVGGRRKTRLQGRVAKIGVKNISPPMRNEKGGGRVNG